MIDHAMQDSTMQDTTTQQSSNLKFFHHLVRRTDHAPQEDGSALVGDVILKSGINARDAYSHLDQVTGEDVVNRLEAMISANEYDANQISANTLSDTNMDLLIEDVRTYTREKQESMFDKTKKKRREALKTKADYSVRAKSVFQDDTGVNTHISGLGQLLAGVIGVNVTTDLTNGHKLVFDPQEDAEKIATAKISLLQRVENFYINVTDYKDDNDFLKRSDDVFKKRIATMSFYKEFVEDDNNMEAFDERARQLKMTTAEYRLELRQKISDLENEKKYYETKMLIMQSPYYAILTKDDFGELTDEELQIKINYMHEQGKTGFEQYLRLLLTLSQTKLKHSKGTDKRKKGNFRLFGEKIEYTSTKTERVHTFELKGEGPASANIVDKDKSKYEETLKDYKDPITREEEARGESHEETPSFGNQLKDSLELGISANYSYTREKQTIKAESEHVDLEAGYTWGEVIAKGSAGLSAFKDGEFALGGHIALSGEVSALSGHANASVGTATKVMGLKVLEGKAKAKGSLLKLKGKVKTDIGQFKNKDGNDQIGADLKVEAGAYLASGTVGASVSLLGVEAGVKAEGNVGFGFKLDYVHTAGRMKFTVGVTVLIGANITFDIDYGPLLTALGKKFINLFRPRGRHLTA